MMCPSLLCSSNQDRNGSSEEDELDPRWLNYKTTVLGLIAFSSAEEDGRGGRGVGVVIERRI